LPPLIVEAAVGLGLPALLVLIRVALYPAIGGGAPFAQVFVGVVGAAVLAGWRSGLMALVAGQLLSWVYLIEPRGSASFGDPADLGGLFLSSLSELLALIIITLYQREVERAWSRREGQMDLLQKALKEIDHRTSNNYQTVLALILAQAKTAEDMKVTQALHQVADRIRAIAAASRKLAIASENLEEVRIAEHLHDLCDGIERGLSRPGVKLDCEIEDVMLGADQTICVSILVNEFVTNALKHAFPGDRSGTIRVALNKADRRMDLVVEDDGVGIEAADGSRGTGLGKRLIETFVKQLKARHEVASGPQGTRNLVRIPV
jgi:two-component sensor histidine kinase